MLIDFLCLFFSRVLSGVFLGISPCIFPVIIFCIKNESVESVKAFKRFCFYSIFLHFLFSVLGIFFFDYAEYHVVYLVFIIFVVYLLFYSALSILKLAKFNFMLANISICLICIGFSTILRIPESNADNWASMLEMQSISFGVCLAYFFSLILFNKTGYKIDLERLRPPLSFLLFLSCGFLLSKALEELGIKLLFPIILILFLTAFGFWLKSFGKITPGNFLLISTLTFVPYLYYVSSECNHIAKYNFTKARLDALIEDGFQVFVLVKADWCVTCVNNNKFVFQSKQVADAFKKTGTIYMVADMTTSNSEAAKYMRAIDKNDFPQNILYKPSGEVIFLPRILSKEKLVINLCSQ